MDSITLGEVFVILEKIRTALSIIFYLTGIIGGYFAYKQYKLKSEQDLRLKQAELIAADVNLLKLFTETMSVAHCRKEYILSENIASGIINSVNGKKEELLLRPEFIQFLKDSSLVAVPVGMAEQDAAIASIYELGKKHELLYMPSLQALKSIAEFKEAPTTDYLNKLVAHKTINKNSGDLIAKLNN